MKFEVGDLVRLTEEGAEWMRAFWGHNEWARDNFVAGAIGVVVCTPYDWDDRFLVRFDGLKYPTYGDLPDSQADGGWYVPETCLEKVNIPIVGDRVKVVKQSVPHYGDTGVVLMLLTGSSFTHLVKFDNGDTIPYGPNEIMLCIQPDVVLKKPEGLARVDEATIKRWIVEMNDQDGGIQYSGDVLVHVDKEVGKAYVYRLEAVSELPKEVR